MQSKSWEQFGETTHFVEGGFPFSEGFPPNAVGKWFLIRIRNGEQLRVQVNYSHQYSAEGLSWKTENGKTIYGHVVVCWKQDN